MQSVRKPTHPFDVKLKKILTTTAQRMSSKQSPAGNETRWPSKLDVIKVAQYDTPENWRTQKFNS